MNIDLCLAAPSSTHARIADPVMSPNDPLPTPIRDALQDGRTLREPAARSNRIRSRLTTGFPDSKTSVRAADGPGTRGGRGLGGAGLHPGLHRRAEHHPPNPPARRRRHDQRSGQRPGRRGRGAAVLRPGASSKFPALERAGFRELAGYARPGEPEQRALRDGRAVRLGQGYSLQISAPPIHHTLLGALADLDGRSAVARPSARRTASTRTGSEQHPTRQARQRDS